MAAHSPSWWRSPIFWLLLWGVASFAGRVAVSPAVMWDQAEQLVWTQELALGYGPQPPLYTWLQWAVNQVMGPTAASLALLKFTLMTLTFGFMALAARQLMPAPTAWLAALGLWWLPGFEWQVLRDLTHTVLLTCMVAASWWLLLRQIRQPSPAVFAALGLALGLGVLSKYSYVLFASSAGGAALMLAGPRRALLSRGWWLTPLVALAVVAPHAAWVLTHWHDASGETLTKMHGELAASPLQGMALGLWDVVRFSVIAVLPFLLVSWWAFGRRAWRQAHPAGLDGLRPMPWAAPLWARYFGLLYAGFLAMVLVTRTANFEGRWLHPLLCVVPVAAFSLRPWLGLNRRGFRRSVAAVAVVAVFLSASVLLDCWVDALRGRTDRFNWDLTAVGTALRATGYDGKAPIITGHHTSAGNLRIVFPEAQVVDCEFGPRTNEDCVRSAVMQARQAGKGWLAVALDRPESEAWWDDAQIPGAQTAPSIQILHIPMRWSRHGEPLLSIHAQWQPPFPQSPAASPTSSARPASPTAAR